MRWFGGFRRIVFLNVREARPSAGFLLGLLVCLEVMMPLRIARKPVQVAGLAMIVAAVITGCGASSSITAGVGGSSATAQVTPLKAVQLAAYTSSRANSVAATMNIQLTVNPGAAGAAGLSGNTSMTMTFAEQLHPSVLISATIGSLISAGKSVPGEISEIVTPKEIYLKVPGLPQTLHVTKPWLAIPLSSANSLSGVNLSQLMNQVTSNSPLSDSEMFAGATSVRQVGTGSIDGVPVTEYTGTVPLSRGLSYLSGSAKTQAEQEMTTLGLTTAKFTVWIDGQHITRKAVMTITGASVTETVNMAITSINQPVNITAPPTSQTAPLPSNAG